MRKHRKEMNRITVTLALALCGLELPAQNQPLFKDIPLTEVTSLESYTSGNPYQKDAILFVDMLSSTHPYYIDAERREVLASRLPTLLEECARCNSDSVFVELLRATMLEVHDRHTEVMDAETYAQRKTAKKSSDEGNHISAAQTGSPMERNGQLFSYHILEKESICYLQFNQCNDARTLRDESQPRFDNMLNEMFAGIDSLDVHTLIVDLQYNGGGSSRLCDELLDRLCPLGKLRQQDPYLRFSPLLALYNPKAQDAMKAWNDAGHTNELYPMPSKPIRVPEHDYYQRRVVFIQGPKTYSSAGILVTTVRDNGLGIIAGTTSTYSPSHYGEVLPFRLPNTGVLGTVCTKYFERADKSRADETVLEPDVYLNLENKEEAWMALMEMYSE